MPDQLPVPEDLFDTVQWNTVQLTLVVIQVECKMIVWLEENLAQWHANNAVLQPVIVADLEFSLAELSSSQRMRQSNSWIGIMRQVSPGSRRRPE
jgi:hypothetical protein